MKIALLNACDRKNGAAACCGLSAWASAMAARLSTRLDDAVPSALKLRTDLSTDTACLEFKSRAAWQMRFNGAFRDLINESLNRYDARYPGYPNALACSISASPPARSPLWRFSNPRL